jgi:NADH-quinone oxidoreductase subunit G
VANPRPTKTERYAGHVLRYPYGAETAAVLGLVNALSPKRPELPAKAPAGTKAAAEAIAAAENLVVLYGSEGLGLAGSAALAQACANLLTATGHVRRPNNGLIAVWSRANDQGAWEIGWRPSPDLGAALGAARALYIAAADPAGDDPALARAVEQAGFVVVQELFLTETARLADVVLPALPFTEREGSYTSGERRVQRYYPALQPNAALPPRVESPGSRRAQVLTGLRAELDGPQADFAIPAFLAEKLGYEGFVHASASLVFARLAAEAPSFGGLSYQKLAEVHEQWPIVGRSDLYYGGTTYENTQGLGVQLPLAQGGASLLSWPQVADFKLPKLGGIAFPITRLYDRGATLMHSQLLHKRIGEPYIILSKQEASRLKISQGGFVRITFTDAERSVVVQAKVDEGLPERVVLAPRSFGLPISGPTPIELKPAG